MAQTYHLNKEAQQERLKILEHKVGEKLDDLLEYFKLHDSLKRTSRFYVGNCPIHDGDKNNAFNIFHDGYKIVGNWKCHTAGCHKIFHPTVIGFTRGILSNLKSGWRSPRDTDKIFSFKETLNFLGQFCGLSNLSDIKIDFGELEKRKFADQINNIYNPDEPEVVYNLDRSVLNSLDIPDPYFISRGYSKEILNKHSVGLCRRKGAQMNMRSVVPVFDSGGEHIVGCLGRSIFEKCPLCDCYHNPTQLCPAEKVRWTYTKWKNSFGFKGEKHLYNYWNSKDHIRKSGIAILVESAGNVWRLEEAGFFNAVATFGAHLTTNQQNILDKSGCFSLVILYDNDSAGILGTEAIRKDLGKLYNVHVPQIALTDIGDMKIEELRNKLCPIMEKIKM